MKKEDFNHGSEKYYITDGYVYDNPDYVLIINDNIFNEDTIVYANKLINSYLNRKDEVIEYMLEAGLREFYGSVRNYSDEYIKNNLGRPMVTINSKKDDQHPEWKFKYRGVIDFLESKLDEHIISIEFKDDLVLIGSVQLNG